MKILTKYMALKFLKPFVYGLALFAILIFLGDLFDKLPRMLKSNAPFSIILQYLWLEVPYWGIRVIPLATLLATLVAVGGLVSSGEWAAVQAAGFETKTILRPLLWMSLGVTIFSFAVHETVLPWCFSRAQSLWRERIHPSWQSDEFRDIILWGGQGQFITARVFTPKDGRMQRPVMDYYSGGRLERQIDASSAAWDPEAKVWVFFNGIEREFVDGEAPREKRFKEFSSELDTPPQLMVPRRRDPDEMSLRETRRYLKQVRFLGASPRQAQIAMHAKLSYPFANLILCALGIPIALKLRQSHRAMTAVVALGVGFLYLWLMEMSKTLGIAGWVPPPVAAWAPHLVFASVALWLYRATDV